MTRGVVAAIVGLIVGFGIALALAHGQINRNTELSQRNCQVTRALRTYVLADTQPLNVPDTVEPGVRAWLLQRDQLRADRKAVVLARLPKVEC